MANNSDSTNSLSPGSRIGRVHGQPLGEGFRRLVGDDVTDFLEKQNKLSKRERLARAEAKRLGPIKTWEEQWKNVTGEAWSSNESPNNDHQIDTVIAKPDAPEITATVEGPSGQGRA